MKTLKYFLISSLVILTFNAHAVFFDADGRSYSDDYTGVIYSAEYEEYIVPADITAALKSNSGTVFFDSDGRAYSSDYEGVIFSAEYEEYIIPAEFSRQRSDSGKSCFIFAGEFANADGLVWSVEYEEFVGIEFLCGSKN